MDRNPTVPAAKGKWELRQAARAIGSYSCNLRSEAWGLMEEESSMRASTEDSARTSADGSPKRPLTLKRDKLTFRSLYRSQPAPSRFRSGRAQYDPEQIFRIIFQRHGSALLCLRTLRRALALLPVAVLACTLNSRDSITAHVPSSLLNALSLLAAFLVSVRLNDAYSKWENAARATERLLCVSNSILTRLTAFTLTGGASDTPLTARLVRIRRLLVLCNVLIKKHVRSEKDLEHEAFLGLVQQEEVRTLSVISTAAVTLALREPVSADECATVRVRQLTRFKAKATRNATDGKVDKFPSRNRFAAILQLIMADAASMYRSGCAACHVHVAARDRTVAHRRCAHLEARPFHPGEHGPPSAAVCSSRRCLQT